MNVSENVYVSDKIKHPKWIIRRFKAGRIIPGIYVVRLALPPDSVEIIRADFFKQKSLIDDSLPIVAFMKSYKDAVEFVVDITNKSLEMFGFPDIRRFLSAEI